MPSSTKKYLWVVLFFVLIALAIPWFLWGTNQVLAGLPIWIWWHIGWMILAAITFQIFATRDWGLFIEEDPT